MAIYIKKKNVNNYLLFFKVGESSGKPSVSIIKSLDNDIQKVNKEMSDLQKAALLRGEKLSELDQRAEQLNMAASEHARIASELSKKYKKKSQWFS
jgi:prefoldin subunit 5